MKQLTIIVKYLDKCCIENLKIADYINFKEFILKKIPENDISSKRLTKDKQVCDSSYFWYSPPNINKCNNLVK